MPNDIDLSQVKWDDEPAQEVDLSQVKWDDEQPAEEPPAAPKLALPPKPEHPARKYSASVETARAGLRGLTLGASDVIGAGVAAGAAALSPDVDFADAYRDIKTDISGQRDVFREEQPAAAYGAEIAGAVLPAIVSGGAAMPAVAGGFGRAVAKGAALGAGQGATYGATQANVGEELQGAKEGGLIGGAVGGALPVAGRAVKSVISPKASTNADLQRLKDMGVTPTIGQTLGGLANDIEQKLTSVPFAGKKIAEQRFKARDQFNNGVINEVLKPLGAKVSGTGFDAIKQAGDIASKKYDDALSKIDGVMFDDAFNANLAELRQAAGGMTEESARRFEKLIQNNISPRMSEAGGMLPETYKRLQSEIGKISANATDKEYADITKQLGQLMKEQMYRSNPAVAKELKDADAAWAMLVRVEDAAKRAVNSDGVFTPAQLNAAIKSADKSTRGRAVARGEALLQKDASIGQKILANTEPDSGTVGRLAMGSSLLSGGGVAGMLSGAASAPALIGTASGIGALRAAYSSPVQNALVRAVSSRGANAPMIGRTAENLLADRARQSAVVSAQ